MSLKHRCPVCGEKRMTQPEFICSLCFRSLRRSDAGMSAKKIIEWAALRAASFERSRLRRELEELLKNG